MVTEYRFETPREDRSFNIFPNELESDPNIFFHGTTDANRESIFNNGFRCEGELASISFSKTSNLALSYACKKGGGLQDGCVLAVRFDSIPDKAAREVSLMYIYEFNPQPTMMGYIVVPKDYKFI